MTAANHGPNPSARAVVVGLASVTGLQTARILARRGVRVIGVAGNLRHFAARTRVCERIIGADVHSDAFVDVLKQLGPELHEPAVLFPCTDQAVLAVSCHREVLESWYHVVLPTDDVVRTLADKSSLYAHADRHGLPVPVSFTLTSRAEAERAADALTYPSVLKPSLKSPGWKRHAKFKALPVSSPAELVDAFDRLAPWTEALVAQEYVVGGDDRLYTCNVYYDAAHRPLITFTTRKRRQWPPHVGTASYAEECLDHEIVAETLRLFDTVEFRGLGYLELKRDAETGRDHVMEANIGRPTGRSATAEAGGVELLYTMYCDAVGLPLPAERTQRHAGAAWVDVRRDLLSALYYHRRGELRLTDWCRELAGHKAHAVLSMRDPLPFLFELGQSARKALRRVSRRRQAPSDPLEATPQV